MAGGSSEPAAGPARSSSDASVEALVVSESDALALLAHLVTSAELCMSEPHDYGIFRLVDAASRLARAMVPRSSGESRAYLEAFIEEVDEKKMWPTRDRERYGAFLRETSRGTAEHLMARAGGGVSAAHVPESGATRMPAGREPGTDSSIEAGERDGSADLVLETIRSRRVTRAFDDRPVDDASLHRVLEAGRWATSGGNRRIHRFLVVRDPDALARLRAVTPGMFSAPPVVIVICTDATRAAEGLVQLEHDRTTWIDVGTAAMNMMIAAHALKLGACPVTSFSHVAAGVVLGLPPTVEAELFLLLGHPLARQGPARPANGGRRDAVLPAGLVSWERLGREAPEYTPIPAPGSGPAGGDPHRESSEEHHP